MFPLSEGKIVVRVIRCDIAVPDILKPYQLAHEPPFVPGSRVCASVTKVDDAVTGIQVGDKVFCHLLDGGLTNEFVLSAEDVYKYSPGINADDSTENTVVSQVGFDDQSESRQGIKRPRGLEVNAMEEQPTAEHWMVAGLLWERERKEYVEEMVNALVTEDQKSKQKIAAFYDECRKAMYHDLISSKTFGEVDMLAICAAYEKKYGVVLDERCCPHPTSLDHRFMRALPGVRRDQVKSRFFTVLFIETNVILPIISFLVKTSELHTRFSALPIWCAAQR